MSAYVTTSRAAIALRTNVSIGAANAAVQFWQLVTCAETPMKSCVTAYSSAGLTI